MPPSGSDSPAVASALVLLLGLLSTACGGADGAPAREISFPAGWPYAADAEPVRGSRAMVSTTDRYATRVGVDVLRDGGNAVDAAVAVAFALAVVNPEAGNIGGGGFLVARMADGTTVALDYREKAPFAATRDMFLDEEGNLTDRSVVGHLASGVPGTVMGLWQAHQRLGRLPWERLVDPAVELAEGLTVRERLAASLRRYQERLRLFESTAETFLPGGRPPAVGETFRQPELAATLRRIRERGAEGFYSGETADLIVAEMERGGGIISHRDLEEYAAAWREPLRFEYRGHRVISMPPVSSGGATMAEIANILEGWDLGSMEWHGPEHVHLMAEAFKRAYADRNTYLADPDFVDVPLERMTSETYAAERRASISRHRATPSGEVGPGLGAPDTGEHTTHFSVVDPDGSAVSLTTTINSSYGSRVTVTGAGFLLNNEMDDFAAKPGTPNQYGLVEGEANAVEPGKRMLSSMTPSIVLDASGNLFLVLGTPGGGTIITTVFQTISNVVDFGMTGVQAVHAPRVHHQHLPDQLRFEAGGLPQAVVSRLEAMGHRMSERDGFSGDVQAVMVLPDGSLVGVSDPRRGGAAMGY